MAKRTHAPCIVSAKAWGAPKLRLVVEAFNDRLTQSLPAVRGRWTGTAGGSPAVGVLYCVLVGHSVVSLHTQDVGSEITPAMYSAIGAIEGVRLR